MDVLTKAQRHKNMSHIRNKGTKIECAMRQALWEKGYRYSKNFNKLPGKPDIAITKYRIAIFCDSEYFHGKDWEEQKKRVEKGNNSEFWINKIERNIQRDTEVEIQLRAMDWIVLRFWGKDILKNPDECVRVIEEAISERKRGMDCCSDKE